MKTLSSLLVLYFFSQSVMAYTYIKCGQETDFDSFSVSGYELELSSESDNYSGPVGKEWNLKLGSEDSEWLAVNSNITATQKEDDSIEITIKKGQSVTGAVGIKYVVKDLWEEEPTVEKYSVGGFAGLRKIATFKCLNGNI